MSWLEHFVTGQAAGMVGLLSAHPFDTVRIRQQTSSGANKPGWDVFKQIAKREGVRGGLMRGVLSPLLGVGFQNAILFSTYGPTLEYLGDSNDMWNVYAAGCIGGAAQVFVCTPLELVKIRLQTVRTKPKRGLRGMLRQIAGEERGLLRGVYRGFSATLLRDMPSYGVWFVSYELGKSYLSSWPDVAAHFCAGGLAGMVSWTVVYPIDVCKSRIQGSVAPLTMIQALRDGYQAGGLAAFFPGYATTMARAFIVSAVTFVAFEAIAGQFLRD